MTIKKKLSLGLGFLFLIIFVLVVFSSYEIGKLSKDAANILKDNYRSIVYSKNMMSALDDMMAAASSLVLRPAEKQDAGGYHPQLFASGRTEFEKGLALVNSNVTEAHEKDYVDKLNADYQVYLNLCLRLIKGPEGDAFFRELEPAYAAVRQSVGNIHDINMLAVERKSLISERDSARIIRSMAVVGVFCLILAFFYFWYFPFYVSNSISYLSGKMKDLLKKANIELDIRTSDEAHILLQAINLLESKLSAEGLEKTSGRKRASAGRK